MDEAINGEDETTDIIGCTADMCSFEGSISEVADHVTESDKGHTWEALGHESADEFCYFCYDAHFAEGQQLVGLCQQLGESPVSHCRKTISASRACSTKTVEIDGEHHIRHVDDGQWILGLVESIDT
ncbi:hypothetical protein ACFR99_01215 [Haloarchaeobius amylolyticus]|uniref:Uncharacterized protein n=1 Tax=Haloarchaeobius amylolyticus TaxID=1198296 RepID=A0ABD6BAW5_9EURY